MNMKENLVKVIENAVEIVEALEKKNEKIYKKRAHIMKRLKKWEAARKERYARVPDMLKQQISNYYKEAYLLDRRIAKLLIEHVLELMVAEDEQRTVIYLKLKKLQDVLSDEDTLVALLNDQKSYMINSLRYLQSFREAAEKVLKINKEKNLIKLTLDIKSEEKLINKFNKDIDKQIKLIKKEERYSKALAKAR